MSKELVPSYEGTLPKGWAVSTIGDLISSEGIFIDGDWVESKDQDPNGSVRLLQLADVGDGFYKNKSSRFLTNESALNLNCTFLKKGDILVARMPDPLGRACLFPGDEKECVTVVDVCVIRAGLESAIQKWLLYWINSPRFRNTISSLQSGTTRRRISRGNLATITFPVPPPEQQKRIVAKIEELFSHIDAGIASLKQAKKLLKQYRQSVLKAAVTGELTKQWREENKGKLEPASQLLERILTERRQKWEQQQLEQFKVKGKMPKDDGWKEKYKERPFPSAEDLPEIPKVWKWVELQHVFDVITDGDHQAPPKADEGIPFLVIGDVNKGVINFRDKRFVPRSYYEGLAEIRRPRKGDLLYTVVGSFGIPVKVESEKEFCVQRHIAILKLNENLSLDYIYHILSSGFVFKQATEVATGTAQKTVPLGGLREIEVPLMSQQEQIQISEIVNEKLSSLERLEMEIDLQLTRAEKNKQSILASAFSGNLVEALDSDGDAQSLISVVKASKMKAKVLISKRARPQGTNKGKLMKKPILDILKETSGVTVTSLMQQAGYSADDIESFYEELSSVSDSVVEIRPEGENAKSWPYNQEVELKLK